MKIFTEISPEKNKKVCSNCKYFERWGVATGTCSRPNLRGNNTRSETQTCYKFKKI